MFALLFNARTLVILWIVGFVGAGLAMSVLQETTAAQSCWGANVGWQTEVAIWNLGAILILAGVLRSKKQIEPYILPGLFVLSLAFSVNHLVAILRHDGVYMTNLAAAVVNGGGVLLLLSYFFLGKRAKTFS
mgnify:CR=1 FL=1